MRLINYRVTEQLLIRASMDHRLESGEYEPGEIVESDDYMERITNRMVKINFIFNKGLIKSWGHPYLDHSSWVYRPFGSRI